jgi:hypothetical protein
MCSEKCRNHAEADEAQKMAPPGRSYAQRQAAKTTLFAAGNKPMSEKSAARA